MLHETWRDQCDRMKRSVALLEQIGEPTATPQDVIPPRDVVYHFCCDALHLRDYITASLGTDPASWKRLEALLNTDVIKPSEELSACRDVANGSKHLVLDGPTYLASGTHVEVVGDNIAVGVPTMRVKVTATASATVRHPDGSTDADDPVVAQPPSPTAPAPVTDSTDGYIQDTFTIEINGQDHDARCRRESDCGMGCVAQKARHDLKPAA